MSIRKKALLFCMVIVMVVIGSGRYIKVKTSDDEIVQSEITTDTIIEVVSGDKEETKININEADIKPIQSQIYSGKPIKPEVKIEFDGSVLKKGEDYLLTYDDNVKVGSAKVIIEGIGNFEGTYTLTFKIIEKKSNDKDVEIKKISINNALIDDIKDQYYTGYEIKPSLNVRVNNKILKKDKDYKITYSNNVSVGKAQVKVSGLGDYEGEKVIYFCIKEEKKEIKTIVLNQLTTHHGFKGYYTKDDNIIHVDKQKLEVAQDDSISLYFIEYYDQRTKESILFACPYVQEAIFMQYVDQSGGWDSIPVKVIE